MTKKPSISALDMPDLPQGQLPPHLELRRTRVLCGSDAPTHTESYQYSNTFASVGVANRLGYDYLCKNLRIEIIRLTDDDIEFDMVGIDAALANAFRRILIAEIPTMAIEKVLMVNNTSVIPDEVLSHRLGLIPVDADARLLQYLSVNDTSNENNTIVFKLEVSCKKGDPRMTVKSNQLKWLPNGSQLFMNQSSPSASSKCYTSFSCSQDIHLKSSKKPNGLKHDDIIIAKLGPGQEIELEAHAVKGTGKTHAKWSPVSTAWYRMLPEVVFLKDIENEMAEELVAKCPVKVFDIEDIGKGTKKAVVSRPRSCTLCRECIRGNGWEELVSLRRVKNHFIFTVESAGALPPEVLFTEAVKILEEKCGNVISDLS